MTDLLYGYTGLAGDTGNDHSSSTALFFVLSVKISFVFTCFKFSTLSSTTFVKLL